MSRSVLSPDATEPKALIHLAFTGAISLATGLLVLGLGLVRSARTPQRRVTSSPRDSASP